MARDYTCHGRPCLGQYNGAAMVPGSHTALEMPAAAISFGPAVTGEDGLDVVARVFEEAMVAW
jgi:hypothetical protein